MKFRILTYPFLSIVITIVLFLFVPNSILMYIAILPYSIWATWHLKKWKIGWYIFGIIIFIIATFSIVILPIIQYFYSYYTILNDFLGAIFPSSFKYRWIDDPPNYIYINLSIIFVLILFIECLFWFARLLNKNIQNKKAQMLVMSSFLGWISFIYIVFSYIAILIPGLMNWFESYIIYTIVYDFFFKLLPFMVIYFIIRYLLKQIRKIL